MHPNRQPAAGRPPKSRHATGEAHLAPLLPTSIQSLSADHTLSGEVLRQQLPPHE